MRRILIVSLSLIHLSAAGALKYPVSDIPANIKADVDLVIREDKMIYTIFSRGKGRLYSLYAVTIFNEKGNYAAERSVGYNKLIKITDINAAVYDAAGKLIKKLKNSEIKDQSAFDGFSLFSDHRLKSVDLSQSIYPYTVEFEYDIDYKYLYDIAGTNIISAERVSVQNASYQLIYPVELKPRVKTINLGDQQPRIEKKVNGTESMSWAFSNMMPITFEPYGPYHETLVPRILAAPCKFEYDGYPGDMTSWEEYGKWQLTLNKGRDDLPEATKRKIKELTKGALNTEQKAKIVYQYLQSKTRYVSIQLGIGGLQPFAASVVDETGYGDCKALSNYMVAMLKEIGIKSYYTIVMAGDDEAPLMTDFPSHQFNHVIVAVPSGADTLWLECTSQLNPFGYQGKFTGGRKALMITENGGKLVNTLRYSAEQNSQVCTADVKIDKTGNASARATTVYSGLQYENGGLADVVDRSYDDQKKWLQKNTDIPGFDIVSFNITNKKDKIPSAMVTANLSLNRLATASGKRLFMTANLMNRLNYSPEKVENRKTDVLRKTAYTDFDTIRYSLPEELYPEFLPDMIAIRSRFGEYTATFKLHQGKMVYTRRVTMRKGIFPADSYNELIEFYKKISKADNTKVVFLNKT